MDNPDQCLAGISCLVLRFFGVKSVISPDEKFSSRLYLYIDLYPLQVFVCFLRQDFSIVLEPDLELALRDQAGLNPPASAPEC